MSTSERRQRVSTACTPCRKKKCKCDGGKPACRVCERDGDYCDYIHQERRKPPSKCFIHALQSRIKFLENQLEQSQESWNQANVEHQQHPSGQPSSFDEDSRLFGVPSSMSIFQSPRDIQGNERDFIVAAALPLESLSFIDPSVQGELLEEFFIWQNSWPLLIHEPLFRKDLAANGSNSYCGPALLLSILSLSAQYTDSMRHSYGNLNWSTLTDSLAERAKATVLAHIETPSLSFALAAAVIAIREFSVGNITSVSQYIGIAIRHAMLLRLHIEENKLGWTSQQHMEACSIAWKGIWMLEKNLSQIIGHPSAIREYDTRPTSLPIIPDIEFCSWAGSSTQLPSYQISSFQHACDLFQMVSPVLDNIYMVNSPMSFEEKENQAMKTFVSMSEFFNHLPSFLRMPSSGNQPQPPYVYQFNLQYHTLKVMLHRPFIRLPPSMAALENIKNSSYSHLQSATFSAIRITWIINSFKRLYPMYKLSPLTVHSLSMASLMFLFNASSKDSELQERSIKLNDLNFQILNQMSSTTKYSIEVINTLRSITQKRGLADTPQSLNETPTSNDTLDFHNRNQYTTLRDLDTLGGIEPAVSEPNNMPTPEHLETNGIREGYTGDKDFGWFDLPLNDVFLVDGVTWEDIFNEGL